MKVDYEKPMIEFEEYELNTAIASCKTIVTLGPGDADHLKVCDEYIQILGLGDDPMVASTNGTGAFYENSCSCYLSSGDSTLLTS